MKKMGIVVLTVLALICVAYADDVFNRADLNKDGKIDKAEFEKAVEKKFREYDKNGDGVLDKSEIRAIRKASKDRSLGREFRRMDANRDGKIDLKEFKEAAYRRFREYDRNGDGVIDRPEIDFRGRYQDPASIMKPFGGFYF